MKRQGINIELNIGGKELAKVLYYYGLLDGDGEFKIICPFHADINASMKINLFDGSFYCFGCQVSGDALKFVKLAEPKLNDLESCHKYFTILKSKKVKHIKQSTHNIKRNKNKKDYTQLLDEAHDYYYGLKTNDWKKQTPERKYMNERGYNFRTLQKCKAKINYNKSYPIIFPIMDMGEFKGWVCRTMDSEVEKKRKYLYNLGFSRRDTLVGRYDNSVVMVVEGYMDWLKMKQFGVKYVCAILGWKATAEQIEKLKSQGVKYIISALDTDKCGIEGTKHLSKYFNVIRFEFPKGVKDPGDLDEESFIKANIKTKQKYREEIKYELSRQNQKSSQKVRSKQK